jgi:hypothetical protein
MKAGVLAGIIGVGALSLSDRLERAWLGRAPLYAPGRIAARLFRLRSRRRARLVGTILRWSHGLPIAAARNRSLMTRSWRALDLMLES